MRWTPALPHVEMAGGNNRHVVSGPAAVGVNDRMPVHASLLLMHRRKDPTPMDNTAADQHPAGQDADGQPHQAIGEGLSRRDRDILGFERQWWQYAGAKEQAIKEMFSLSPTRYYQVLNEVIDNPAALAEDPLLVRRLRRLRTSRQKARSARRLGFEV
jgi:Protein of unknown function (DUF3263)